MDSTEITSLPSGLTREPFSLDKDILFGRYRAQGLELIVEPVTNPVTPEKRRLTKEESPLAALVYQLFHYLEEALLTRLLPDMGRLREIIGHRQKLLLSELDKRLSQINAMHHAFVARLVLDLLGRDTHGTPIQTILSQLDELYLYYDKAPVDKARNDYAHVDLLATLIEETYQDSLDPLKDNIFQKHSLPLQRGRKSNKDKENRPHPLNLIKASYILSRKSQSRIVFDQEDREIYLCPGDGPQPGAGQPQLDKYPLFLKTLSIYRQCLPVETNHGWFTSRIRLAARRLSPREWPMHGLVASLLNMQGVIERRKITLGHGPRRYYCCYTGLPLEAGEEVWLIRILVHSAERHETWQRNGELPAVCHTSPMLTGSIRSYFMKTSVCAIASLFYSPFTEAYKRQFPEFFAPHRSLAPACLLPANRCFLYTPLWYQLNRLHRFITESKLYDIIWQHGESYTACVNRIMPAFMEITEEDGFENSFSYFIFYAILGWKGEACIQKMFEGERDRLMAYIQDMVDIMIDFVELMFDFGPMRESISSLSFSLPSLGFELTGDPVKDCLLRVHPQLTGPVENHFVLSRLLALSDQRRQKLNVSITTMVHHERMARLRRLELSLTKHPFLFLFFYESIYETSEQLPLLSSAEGIMLLTRLGITLNNAVKQ